MAEDTSRISIVGLPERPVQRWTRPLVRFLHVQSASGVLLVLVTVVALALANSDLGPGYAAFWEQKLRIGVGGFELNYPLWYWINDALMTVFFFVIGLEIKRELTLGELNEPRRVVLPVLAALGGAVVPVAIFLALQFGAAGQSGWAVPMATDIAFVVGALALLGERVPRGLKVLMLSLAIVDDILAVVVIAAFYTGSIKLSWALGAVIGLLLTAGMNRFGVRKVAAYVLVACVVWLCALKSGVHPTVAGVVLGLLTPINALFDRVKLNELLGRGQEVLRPESDAPEKDRRVAVDELGFVMTEATSPLARLESALHPWVAFAIMPIFALANAGVKVELDALASPLAVAVALGLVVGKPVGIAGAAWLGVRLGWASLPEGVSWRTLVGGACLGGIGFTMALFIALLGLEPSLLPAAKSGVLLGSLLSGALGMTILARSLSRAKAP